MKEQKLYCGIDVYAATLDVCFQKKDGGFEWVKVVNALNGFKELWKLTGDVYHFVMEHTGVYQLPLCFFLASKKCAYSVVNALQIKRYIQMHLERNKTDKKDARHICRYGIDRNPEGYQMPDQLYFECKALNNAIETMTQETTSFKNKIFAQGKLKIDNRAVLKAYNSILRGMGKELKKLELELVEKLNSWQPELKKLVSSVTGIGKRASTILIVSTQGFKYTETYQQLISYARPEPKRIQQWFQCVVVVISPISVWIKGRFFCQFFNFVIVVKIGCGNVVRSNVGYWVGLLSTFPHHGR